MAEVVYCDDYEAIVGPIPAETKVAPVKKVVTKDSAKVEAK